MGSGNKIAYGVHPNDPTLIGPYDFAQRSRAVSSPTIIVAEDHPMFRAALVLTLRRLMPEYEHEAGAARRPRLREGDHSARRAS